MKKNEITAALEPVLNAFDELGIHYYIGGSVASSAYGFARATLDVDLISDISLFHIKPLVDKLKDDFFIDSEMINDAINAKSSFNILHLDTMLKIDVFILKDYAYAQKAFERKIKDKLEDDLDSLNIYLASPEDVVLSKIEWFKSRGEISERQWLDILGVLKVQYGNLDLQYLRKWAKQLRVFKLLEKSFLECKLKL